MTPLISVKGHAVSSAAHDGNLSLTARMPAEGSSSSTLTQGCIVGLERLGLESLKNRMSRSRLGLEDITSRSRSRSFVTL